MKTSRLIKFATSLLIVFGEVDAASGRLAAQTISAAAVDSHADDVVVTARRTGIPAWRVRGPRTTIVLVGSISRVSAGTRWNPAALDAALAQADRIMFPETMDVGFGLFSIIGVIGKWHAQGSLSAGQTLQTMTTPEQWARLVALRDRGILKSGFEHSHPYHLAMMLSGSVKDKRRPAPGVSRYVRQYVRGHRDKLLPVAQANLRDLTADFFASSPREHVACLMDAVALVEAGDPGIAARMRARDLRSEAWAARRVPEALAAKPDDGQRSCWPQGSRAEQVREASVGPAIRELMNDAKVTLVVVSLDTLAKPGGILDGLVAAGFDVSGPKWKP